MLASFFFEGTLHRVKFEATTIARPTQEQELHSLQTTDYIWMRNASAISVELRSVRDGPESPGHNVRCCTK